MSHAITTGLTLVTPTSECVPPVVEEETPVVEFTPITPATDNEAPGKAIITDWFKVLQSHCHCEDPKCCPGKDGEIKVVAKMNLREFLDIIHSESGADISMDEFDEFAEYLYKHFYVSLDVYCENGSTLMRKNGSADLRAVVLLGETDVTDQIAPSHFTWMRSSGNANADNLWNLQHDGVGPVIHVTSSDVNGACTFNCVVPLAIIKQLNM